MPLIHSENIENQKNYDVFYESTDNNEFLDQKTEILIDLSASIAMSCKPCTHSLPISF